MNRRGFLKFLGIGAATAVIAPKVFSSTPNLEVKKWKWQEALKALQNPKLAKLTVPSAGGYQQYWAQENLPVGTLVEAGDYGHIRKARKPESIVGVTITPISQGKVGYVQIRSVANPPTVYLRGGAFLSSEVPKDVQIFGDSFREQERLERLRIQAEYTADRMIKSIGSISKDIAKRVDEKNKFTGEAVGKIITEWFDKERQL